MSGLYLPSTAFREPKVSREHLAGTRQWEARVKGMMHTTGPILDHWQPVLADIDPLLRLWRAHENAHAAGVLPGYYHLVRLNEGAPMWLMPLMGPQHEFVEPTDAMLRGLRRADLQNPRVLRDRALAARREETAKERAEARDDEDRLAEAWQRVQAIRRTQVLMSPDIPWAQNAAGQKRPTRSKGRE